MRQILLTLLLVAITGCGPDTKPEGQPAAPKEPAAAMEAPNGSDEPSAKVGVSIVNGIGMRFVPIQAGTFTMGEDQKAHQVTLTQAFELGQHEVTQEQYEAVMGTTPSTFKGSQNPVEQVSWNDAVEFCRKLSSLPAEKSAGYVYRLPTEAEWEYACRAGTTTKYSFGDSESKLGEYAWYVDNSGETTHPVGKKKPNAWGLYDMHGNVWEWCQDGEGEYPSGSVTDPTGPAKRSLRVYRGGSWFEYSDLCRSGIGPGWYSPDRRFIFLGFRVLRSSIGTAKAPDTATVKKQMTPAQLALGKPVVNSVGMLLVPIPAGTFTMGDANAADNETPHQVTLTQAFHLGQYEVTQEQYEKVMGTNPSLFRGGQNPVEQVSWNDAVEFCRKLSALPAEKKAGYVYRLPTEAEWEYACRAGTKTTYSFGDSVPALGDRHFVYGWYSWNSEDTTHPVGGKKPNPWGLYDMHGNVWEQCQDWYGKDYYGKSPVADPRGPTSGSYRVVRGGSYFNRFAQNTRSAYRHMLTPGEGWHNYGFRVLRSSIK